MRKAFLAISIISLSVMINGCANKNVTVETGAESELTLESSEIVSQSSAEDIKTVAKVMNTTSRERQFLQRLFQIIRFQMIYTVDILRLMVIFINFQ